MEKIKALRVRPVELAKFIGVTRVTASRWLNGHHSPIGAAAKKIAILEKVITKATKEGLLPFPSGVESNVARYDYLKELTRAYIKEANRLAAVAKNKQEA